MSAQGLVVAALVLGCGVQAAWVLMPAAARRRLAGWLATRPLLPRRLAARFERVAGAASGCGCDGCDRSEVRAAGPAPAGAAATAAAAPVTAQPIVFHRRRPHR